MEYETYQTFKLRVKREDLVEVVRSDGTYQEVTLKPNPVRKRTIDLFIRYLKEERIKSKEEFAVMGSHLYELLFQEDIHNAFKEECTNAQELKSGLRIVLEFDKKARELAEYPWEYLYRPEMPSWGNPEFIAAQGQLVLTRMVPRIPGIRERPAEKGPLRILVVISEPDKIKPDDPTLSMVGADDVKKAIEELERKLPEGTIEVTTLPQPTKKDFVEAVNAVTDEPNPRAVHPHVVHFIGHGRFTKGVGELAFIRSDGGPAWIPDSALADCFTYPKPRLVFLHACETAHTDSYEAFTGVALQLVYFGIPGVIAMQYKINVGIAIKFAARFYEALGKFKPVDVAVQQGRSEIGLFEDDAQTFVSRAFGCPVVYLQKTDQIIVAEWAEAEAALSRCPNCGESVRSGDMRCDNDSCGTWLKCPSCRRTKIRGRSICGACGHDDREPVLSEGRAPKAEPIGPQESGVERERTTVPASAPAPDSPRPGE